MFSFSLSCHVAAGRSSSLYSFLSDLQQHESLLPLKEDMLDPMVQRRFSAGKWCRALLESDHYSHRSLWCGRNYTQPLWRQTTKPEMWSSIRWEWCDEKDVFVGQQYINSHIFSIIFLMPVFPSRSSSACFHVLLLLLVFLLLPSFFQLLPAPELEKLFKSHIHKALMTRYPERFLGLGLTMQNQSFSRLTGIQPCSWQQHNLLIKAHVTNRKKKEM